VQITSMLNTITFMLLKIVCKSLKKLNKKIFSKSIKNKITHYFSTSYFISQQL